jgi:hypothetical protein
VASGFIATNNGHVVLKISPKITSKGSTTQGTKKKSGKLHLQVELPPKSRKKIQEAVAEMEKLGFTYYSSQFVKEGDVPKSGISICDWHIPW